MKNRNIYKRICITILKSLRDLTHIDEALQGASKVLLLTCWAGPLRVCGCCWIKLDRSGKTMMVLSLSSIVYVHKY